MKRDDPSISAAPGVLLAIASRARDAMEGVPDDVLHAARRCLVDWTGVAIGGMDEDPPQRLARALGVASGFGAPQSPAMLDALLLGTCGHVLDYDDTDSINLVHASASVVPALIATARRHRVSGVDLLRALAAGYEVESRLGAHLGRPLTAGGWHVSGVLGPFGSAAASTLATREPVERVAQAMAIASTGASGLIAAFGTMSKSLQLGRTAAGGVLAADLARQDYNGPIGVLDGGAPFAKPYVGDSDIAFARAAEAFGSRYAILDNSFKPHASCMITHPAIDAAARVHAQLTRMHADWGSIATIASSVNALVPKVAGIARPASGLEGKFSVGYCIATALVDGHARHHAFTDAASRREAIARLLERMQIDVRPDVGEKQAELVVTLADGRRIAERVDMAKGHPANPLDDDELSAKFASLTSRALGGQRDEVRDELWHFESQPDAGRWIARRLDGLRAAASA